MNMQTNKIFNKHNFRLDNRFMLSPILVHQVSELFTHKKNNQLVYALVIKVLR